MCNERAERIARFNETCQQRLERWQDTLRRVDALIERHKDFYERLDENEKV